MFEPVVESLLQLLVQTMLLFVVVGPERHWEEEEKSEYNIGIFWGKTWSAAKFLSFCKYDILLKHMLSKVLEISDFSQNLVNPYNFFAKVTLKFS